MRTETQPIDEILNPAQEFYAKRVFLANWYRFYGIITLQIVYQHFLILAGVAKLVDAADSKSAGAKHRAGSIPASGTKRTLFSSFFFSLG